MHMKVASKFTDYYDGALHIFPEVTPFYLRETTTLQSQHLKSLSQPRFNVVAKVNNIRTQFYYAILGFCGKLYPIYYTYPHNSFLAKSKYGELFYSKSDLMSVCTDIESDIYGQQNSFEAVNELVKKDFWPKIFIEHRIPVFLYQQSTDYRVGWELIANPALKDLRFFKQMNPYTAIQELEMYFNNELCDTSTPPMPVGSDVVIAASKGFDKNLPKK